MCFGGSKAKEQVPPPPTPPTTFDYQAGSRASVPGDGKPNAAAPTSKNPTGTFGSELGGVQPMGGV